MGKLILELGYENEIVYTETAWGLGEPFPGSNWAEYIVYVPGGNSKSTTSFTASERNTLSTYTHNLLMQILMRFRNIIQRIIN